MNPHGRILLGLSLLAGLSSCSASSQTDAPAEPAPQESRCDAGAPVARVSPGGTPEVDVDALAAGRCAVRIVDVRTRAEVEGTGVIPGSEHVPLEQVAHHAAAWERDQPIVFVCRSGRRSGIAAREVGELGFTQAASLTGGVLAWRESGRALQGEVRRPDPLPVASKRALTEGDIIAHVSDRDHVRMTKAATLLLHGTQACVDGRDAHAIIGTPGGDAGELILALAVAEQLGRAPFSEASVDRVFADYLDAFGHFYLHTDVHAARRWLDSAGVAGDDVDGLLRAPPRDAQVALLGRAAEPAHIGCGHLRLTVERPEAYGVRPGLVHAVLSAYFRRLWSGDARLEFVVLEGSHAESAVLTVQMGQAVHAYSQVPLVSPRVGDTEVFVVHPEVSAFVREQNAAFLLEEVPSLMSAGVGETSFLDALERLAAVQIGETIEALAPGLPVFAVEVHGAPVTVRRMEP